MSLSKLCHVIASRDAVASQSTDPAAVNTAEQIPPATITATMASSDSLTNLPTPPACIADFCIIPLGTPTASVSKEVAEVQRLLKKSGLEYSMHSAGTTVGE